MEQHPSNNELSRENSSHLEKNKKSFFRKVLRSFNAKFWPGHTYSRTQTKPVKTRNKEFIPTLTDIVPKGINYKGSVPQEIREAQTLSPAEQIKRVRERLAELREIKNTTEVILEAKKVADKAVFTANEQLERRRNEERRENLRTLELNRRNESGRTISLQPFPVPAEEIAEISSEKENTPIDIDLSVSNPSKDKDAFSIPERTSLDNSLNDIFTEGESFEVTHPLNLENQKRKVDLSMESKILSETSSIVYEEVQEEKPKVVSAQQETITTVKQPHPHPVDIQTLRTELYRKLKEKSTFAALHNQLEPVAKSNQLLTEQPPARGITQVTKVKLIDNENKDDGFYSGPLFEEDQNDIDDTRGVMEKGLDGLLKGYGILRSILPSTLTARLPNVPKKSVKKENTQGRLSPLQLEQQQKRANEIIAKDLDVTRKEIAEVKARGENPNDFFLKYYHEQSEDGKVLALSEPQKSIDTWTQNASKNLDSQKKAELEGIFDDTDFSSNQFGELYEGIDFKKIKANNAREHMSSHVTKMKEWWKVQPKSRKIALSVSLVGLGLAGTLTGSVLLVGASIGAKTAIRGLGALLAGDVAEDFLREKISSGNKNKEALVKLGKWSTIVGLFAGGTYLSTGKELHDAIKEYAGGAVNKVLDVLPHSTAPVHVIIPSHEIIPSPTTTVPLPHASIPSAPLVPEGTSQVVPSPAVANQIHNFANPNDPTFGVDRVNFQDVLPNRTLTSIILHGGLLDHFSPEQMAGLTAEGKQNFIQNLINNLNAEQLKSVGISSGNADILKSGIHGDKIDLAKLSQLAKKISIFVGGRDMTLLERALQIK
jgi:hypothetical protein